VSGISAFAYDALPGRVVFGSGSAAARLRAEVERLGAQRILLIAAESDLAIAQAVAEPIAERVVATFSGVRPHVPVAVAEQARALARESRAELLLSVGGGSTTGTAKAVALELGLPILAVPTTYAGSEMTPVWGMTDAQRKTTGRSLDVLPAVVIYDPQLTVTLPAAVTGPSAMNAIAHCVEALYVPGANPVTSMLATEGIRALAQGAPAAVAQPHDIDARTLTLYGAYLAGSAFAAVGGGLHHKICHILGGALDLPHAETHTVVLPHVAAFFTPAIPTVMARVAAALDGGAQRPGEDHAHDHDHDHDHDHAHDHDHDHAHADAEVDAAGALYDLGRRLGVPPALRDLGMRESDLEPMIALVREGTAGAGAGDHPRTVDEPAIRAILTGAFEGARPVPSSPEEITTA
jgi:alcohol dehydrogenase class IV